MYVMLYNKQNDDYIFIAKNNTTQLVPIQYHKIGAYVNDSESYTINRVTYSKQQCIQWMHNLESTSCMSGPDLFVIMKPNNKDVYICVWKTKLTKGLEICCNEKNTYVLFDDENKNLLEEINKFLDQLNQTTYKLCLDDANNTFNSHHY